MKNIVLIFIFAFGCINCKKDAGFPNQKKIHQDSLIINNFDEKIDGFAYTKLGLQCKVGNIHEIQKLLLQGADINLGKKDDIYEYDALYVAIEGNHIKIVEYLLKNKAKVNQVYTEEGLTPVGLAVKLNEEEILKLLIKNGGNVNGYKLAETDYKETPLLIALNNNNFQITELLLNAGSDITALDKRGNSIKSILTGKGGKWKKLLPTSQKINIPKGEYYLQDDNLDDYGISLKYENDSIVYTEIGNMGRMYNQFLLKVEKIENGNIFLIFDKTLSGYTGNAAKMKYFGYIYFKNEKPFLNSEYLEKKYNLQNVPLQK